MGENLKVVWVEFSTLSEAIFVISTIARYRQTYPHFKLKTWPRFCTVSLSFSMIRQLLHPKSCHLKVVYESSREIQILNKKKIVSVTLTNKVT
jgi:hypothetical protein